MALNLSEQEELELLALKRKRAQATQNTQSSQVPVKEVATQALKAAVTPVAMQVPEGKIGPANPAAGNPPSVAAEAAKTPEGQGAALNLLEGQMMGIPAVTGATDKLKQQGFDTNAGNPALNFAANVAGTPPIEAIPMAVGGVVSKLSKSMAAISDSKKLALGDMAVDAMDKAGKFMQDWYGTQVRTGIQKALTANPEAVVDVTDSVRNIVQKASKGEIDKTAINAIKRIPGMGDFINAGEVPEKVTMSLKDAQMAIQRLNALGGKGALKHPVRELSRNFMEDLGEQLPEMSQINKTYKDYKTNEKIANNALQVKSRGAGAGEPYQNIQQQDAIQKTAALGNPNAIGEMQNYRDAYKSIQQLKTIGKIAAGAVGLGAADALVRKIMR